MRLLESWVDTPLADAVGWTLLHSLWEGAILAIALGAVLLATRSPRLRYVAACLAMLVMFASFCLTLVFVIPETTHGLAAARTAARRVVNVPSGTNMPAVSSNGLAALAPWLSPFWIAGVCIFYLGHVAGWISVCRLRRRGDRKSTRLNSSHLGISY